MHKRIKICFVAVTFLVGGYSIASAADKIITAYGAVADGRTNNARAIQRAIDEQSKNGGGRVIVPAGNYLSGPIFLKANVELHINLGGVLMGTHNWNDYAVYSKAIHETALVSANGEHNISITGDGIIDGQGQELMLDIFQKLRGSEISEKDSAWIYKRPTTRAMVLAFTHCKDLRVTGITLRNSSGWVQNYKECDGVTIDKMTVQSTTYWNNDGLDITDSKNVRITNCFINSTDDAICLKSENPKAACENVYIENCTLRSSANGLKFGTANYGGFRNVSVRNLTVFDTYRSAIALESVDGGYLDHVDIRDVKATNTGNAIFIRRGHRNTGEVGTLNGVYIANVKVEVPFFKPDQGYPIEGPPDHLRPGEDRMPKRPGSYHIYGHPFLPYNLIPASIVGLPGYPVQNVTLENIEISYGGNGSKDIAWIPLDKVTSVPENPAGYPEFSMWGELPAWGFYIRHAEGIQFKNVKLTVLNPDFRPAIVTDDVKGIELSGLTIPAGKELPVILFNNTSGTSMSKLSLPVTGPQAVQTTNYK